MPPVGVMLASFVGAMAVDTVVRGLHRRQGRYLRYGPGEGARQSTQQHSGEKPFHETLFPAIHFHFIAVFPLKLQ